MTQYRVLNIPVGLYRASSPTGIRLRVISVTTYNSPEEAAAAVADALAWPGFCFSEWHHSRRHRADLCILYPTEAQKRTPPWEHYHSHNPRLATWG